MREGREFKVSIKDDYVLMEIIGKQSGVTHGEVFPPKVAVALGNHLIRKGREILNKNFKTIEVYNEGNSSETVKEENLRN